jgi:hypothetical protein
MSAKKKSQHFVARHYLRRFCFDRGKRIRILTITTGQYIPEAGLKEQCARPYFYNTDPRFEDGLAGIEQTTEEYFKRIVNEHWLPTYGPNRNDLFAALNIMRCRTERFAQQTLKIPETAMRESMRILAQDNNQHELLDFLPQLQFRASNWPTHGVIFALTSTMLLMDLRIRLLIPPANLHFLTTDHPVVFLNQAFVNIVRDESATGLAMRGLQIFLPLSPDLMLTAFDRDCYRVGRPDRTVIQINREEDIQLINALQILNANQCLYFRDQEDEPRFRELLFKYRDKRPSLDKIVEIQKIIESGQEGVLIKSNAPSIPLPCTWSFCKTRHRFARADFVRRNPELCQAHEEYAHDCERQQKLLPLGEWFAEKDAKTALFDLDR